ncbi:MAG: CapA family protein [Clostridiaceae bacterium]|nr:CapA family protein [Clostridiaceae bacterium]
MNRFLIAILALSVFPFNVSSFPVTNNQDKINITASRISQEDPLFLTDLTTVSTEKAMPDPLPKIETIILSFAGDCTIGSDESYRGYTFHKVYREVKDPAYFFSGAKSIFSNDDYTLVNLEGVFTNENRKAEKEFRYKGPPEYCEILKAGSIEGVTLANNHTLDYLQSGYDETIKTLNEWGIDYTDEDVYIIKEIKGAKIGFLGYRGWSHEKKSNQLLVRHVKQMREQGVNFIVVNYHWGDMYSYKPNAQQKSMARFAIDNGADLVIGHHPHVLQGMEVYKGKSIVYSLGNFCYGGKMNPEDKDTIIFQQLITFNITENRIVGTESRIIPARISSRTDINDFRPVIARGDEAERILQKIKALSEDLN